MDTGASDSDSRPTAGRSNPWLLARDPVLLAERQGRWTILWALLGSLFLATSSLWLMETADRIQASVAKRTGTTEAYARADDASVMLVPGNIHTYVNFFAFALALMVPLLVLRHLHRREPFFLWRFHGQGSPTLFVKAAGALLVTSVIGAGFEYWQSPGAFTFRRDWGNAFGWWLMAAVVVLLLQTLAEELVFRGYLLRVWGAVLPCRPVIVAAIIIGFTSLHMANADFKTDMAFNFFGFMLGEIVYFWALMRTGSLISTWGLHFANNLVAGVLMVTVPGTAPDHAIIVFTDPVISAGASRLTEPLAYLEVIATTLLLVGLLAWRRSPFYLASAPIPVIAPPLPATGDALVSSSTALDDPPVR